MLKAFRQHFHPCSIPLSDEIIAYLKNHYPAGFFRQLTGHMLVCLHDWYVHERITLRWDFLNTRLNDELPEIADRVEEQQALYVTVGLIFQAIKKPLLALKMVLMIVIPLITTWSTIIFVDRRFSSIDGDRTAQTLVSIIVGILISFSATIISKLPRFKKD